MLSKEECEKSGGILKDGVCKVEEYKGGITKPLKAGGLADQGIVPIIDALNAEGCPTVASCSGLRSDHYGHEESAYLSTEMPNHVVQGGFGKTPHEVYPENIKKPEVVKCFLDAGKKANWHSELDLYMLMTPTTHFSLPRTKSVKTDELAEARPEVIAAEKKLDAVMGTSYSFQEFNNALKERDRVREAAYASFGLEDWTDGKIRAAWDNLQREVGKCCTLLQE